MLIPKTILIRGTLENLFVELGIANAAGDDVVEHGIANAAGDDVEHGNNIQDAVQLLLRLTQNSTDETIPPASIFKIPGRIRDRCPKAFTPRVVSIGPLHRDDPNLQPFEQKKAIILRDLLGSSPSREHTLETCVQKMYGSMDRIKACYEDRMERYADNQIATMMVMDACFILQLCCKLSGFFDEKTDRMLAPGIFQDLVLIENQIPFFVLQDIFDEFIGFRFKTETKTFSLNTLVNPLFNFLNIFDSFFSVENFEENPDHILGLLHKYYQPHLLYKKSYRSILGTSHSAVELDRAGVNFKPHNYSPLWVMDIELESLRWSKPTIRIPRLRVNDDTELILRNLIAYEQLTPWVGNYITTYVTAMDLLINNAEDVAILVESKVLVNHMTSYEDASKMINDLGKETPPFTEFWYDQQWKELGEYYDGYLPKTFEWFKRTYFKSPWNMFALLGAILLFVLTVVQTYYTIKSVQTNSSNLG